MWTVTIATFDPASPDYRRHPWHPGVFKFELYSVDLSVTRTVGFSLGYGSRPSYIHSGESFNAAATHHDFVTCRHATQLR